MSESEIEVKKRHLKRKIELKKQEISQLKRRLNEAHRKERESENRGFLRSFFDLGLSDLANAATGATTQIAIELAQDELDDLELQYAQAHSNTKPERPQTEEEKKIEAYKERARQKIRVAVDLKAGEKVQNLAALQEWKKSEYRRINHDVVLSADDRIQQIEAVDEAFNEMLRELKVKTRIFEEG